MLSGIVAMLGVYGGTKRRFRMIVRSRRGHLRW